LQGVKDQTMRKQEENMLGIRGLRREKRIEYFRRFRP
jgi:hypothetical protein